MRKITTTVLWLSILLLLAACSGGESTTAGNAAVETASESGESSSMASVEEPAAVQEHDMQEDGTMMEEDDAMASDAEPMADHDASMDDNMSDGSEAIDLVPWQQITLTNARTGETFSLADYSGKTVFVEPMATWCTNCLRQLMNVREARAQLDGDATMFIALSLETNISDDTLAQYANDQGFDWLFAVMTPDLLQELVNTFGRSITSAPSTPHFVIRPDGTYTELTTGIESPAQILATLQAASG